MEFGTSFLLFYALYLRSSYDTSIGYQCFLGPLHESISPFSRNLSIILITRRIKPGGEEVKVEDRPLPYLIDLVGDLTDPSPAPLLKEIRLISIKVKHENRMQRNQLHQPSQCAICTGHFELFLSSIPSVSEWRASSKE